MDKVNLNLEALSAFTKATGDVGVNSGNTENVSNSNKLLKEVSSGMVCNDETSSLTSNFSSDFVDDSKASAAKTSASKSSKSTSSVISDLYNKQAAANTAISTLTSKMNAIDKQINILEPKLNNASNNGEVDTLYALEQQNFSLNSMYCLLQIESAKQQELKSIISSYLGVLNKYPNNSEIAGIIDNMMNLQTQYYDVASQKLTAMQTEDEKTQYNLEQQENTLQAQLRDLKVDLLKAQAKADGRTVSDTEIDLVKSQSDLQFQEDRVIEKRLYLSYKSYDIGSSMTSAIHNEDKYSEYVLEQQENQLEYLDKIFEFQQTSLEKQNTNFYKYINAVRKYPNNKTLANIVTEKSDLDLQLANLRSQISLAVQAEDENSLKNLFSQLNTLNDKLKAAEVNFQKELANASGTKISTDEVEAEFDKQVAADNEQLMQDILTSLYLSVSTSKSEARQNNDNAAITELEKMENNLVQISENTEGLTLDEFISKLTKAGATNGAVSTNSDVTASTTDNTQNTTGNVTTNTTNKKAILVNKNGVPYTGVKGGVLYKDGVAFTGVYKNVLFKDGQKFNGKYEADGKYYKNGVILTGFSTDGLLCRQGVPFTGIKGSASFKNGKVVSGTVNGITYENGEAINGVDANGIMYVNGKKLTGTSNGKLYKNGKLYTGVKDGVLYKDGITFTGVYKNVLFQNGQKFTGKYQNDGKYYYKGNLYTGVMSNGYFYENGVPFTGKKGNAQYKNGLIIST